MIKAYNETEPMTRRISSYLSNKQKTRDSKIAKKMIVAYDEHGSVDELLELWKKYHNLLSDPRYWEILRTVWVTCGRRDNYELFRSYFNSKRPAKGYFMTPEDNSTLKSFNYPMTVYRAAYKENDNGLSWSTDRQFVYDYANAHERVIKEQIINSRSEVFAYINRRGEHELIIL